MPKPTTTLPNSQWATDANYTGANETGTPTKVDPGNSYRAQGLEPNTAARAPYLNWFLNLAYQWWLYLDALPTEAQFVNSGFTWGAPHVFTPSSGPQAIETNAFTNGDGAFCKGNGSGHGGRFRGGLTGMGLKAGGGGLEAPDLNGTNAGVGIEGYGAGINSGVIGYGGYGNGTTTGGYGVKGEGRGDRAGVYGTCRTGGTGAGVEGVGGGGPGVKASHTSAIALEADVTTGTAVRADATTGYGVWAEVDSGGTAVTARVLNTGSGGEGLFCANLGDGKAASFSRSLGSGAAVTIAGTTGGSGLVVTGFTTGFGVSVTGGTSGQAVQGTVTTGVGVRGAATTGVGVLGGGTGGRGVEGSDTTGVAGFFSCSSTGTGVEVERATGYGLKINAGSSTKAHIHLDAQTSPSPGDRLDGDIWFDGSNLYLKHGGSTYTFDLTVV